MPINYDISRGRPQLSAAKQALLEKRLRGELIRKTDVQKIPRRTGTGPGPLSFAQQRLWFIEQLAGDSPAYNIPFGFRLTGQLNVIALERSINEIVRRHEALRTSFATVDGKPEKVIAPVLTVPLHLKDLREFPENGGEAEVRRLALEDGQRFFDLVQCPLFRISLLRLDEEEYVILMTIHHIIYDGWSIGVFMRELTTIYAAFSTGKPSPLPNLSIQYADFAQWQREWLHGEVLEHQLSYWKKQLSGSPPVLELPTDRPRPARQTFQGSIYSFHLSQPLSDAIKNLSQQEGCTLFMTLLAVFKTLLYRYTMQEDILVGSPVANRHRTELEDLIGFFVNTLVLRTDLSGNPTFRELFGRIRKMALEAQAHQDMPFDLLVEELHPERNLSHQPLFQVAFALQNAPMLPPEFPGITLEPLNIHNGTAKFDLFLEMIDTEQGLTATFEYNTDLFNAETITRMAGHFRALLEGIVATPEQRISELPILTKAKRHQILAEWNDTNADYPKDTCIHELFEIQAARTPDTVAVVSPSTLRLRSAQAGSGCNEDQQLTYRELNTRANQLAHYLQTLGVGPEVLVGICVERSLETIVGLLGILKAGGAYVPLDPSYPRERLVFMLRDAGVLVLLTQEKLVTALPEHSACVVCLDTDWEVISQESEKNPVSGVQSENLAYVIYTSGSTGKPKGTLIAHCGLCNVSEAQVRMFEVKPGDHVLQFSSLSFDAATFEIVMALRAGATLCLGRRESLLPGPALIRLLQDQDVSIVTLPPSALANLPDDKLPKLRIIIVAGEACSADLVARWAGGRLFFNLYGPTETTIWATAAKCTDNSRTPSIGFPIINTQIYILDRHLQPVPIGVSGELYVGGVGLARGYLNRPELTRERFIPNPFSDEPEARLYRTGDLARYLPDGNIDFLGRIDYQVKIRGFRIELGEIEVALTQHSDVKETVVIAREDVPGNKYLVAYIASNLIPDRIPYQSDCLVEIDRNTMKLHTEDISFSGVSLIGIPATFGKRKRIRLRLLLPGTSKERWLKGRIAWRQEHQVGIQFDLTPTEQTIVHQSIEYLLEAQGLLRFLQRTTTANLRNHLRQKLPNYMVPSSFVYLNALPLTPNGKVDRRALPVPNQSRANLEEDFMAPQTPTEKVLADIWTKVLNLEQVGVQDNFFELGGHSLLAAQLGAQVKKTFQIELPLGQLFEAPTIAGLAQIIDTVQRREPSEAMHDIPVINFQTEATLDSTIRPEMISNIQVIEPSSLFLTGATGFLGAFLLHDLLQQTRADIYCLVRSSDLEEGRRRIRNNLERYLLWHEHLHSRIIPVPGDLSQPQLGLPFDQFEMLAQRIDVIYHSGAMVNLLYPYSALKPTNVLGTQEILRLASLIKVKPVHYVSTVAVFPSVNRSGTEEIIGEDTPLAHFDDLKIGYSQSKWIAEKLVAAAHSLGIPVSVYRPSRITGHSQTGVWNADDFACRMIKGCIQMGIAPQQHITVENWVPVDYVSRVIVHLSQQKTSWGQTFHLINRRPICWNDLVDWICAFGYPLRKISYERWRKEFCEPAAENALSPLMPLFHEADTLVEPQHFSGWNAIAGLEGTSITCPPVDTALLYTYFTYFIRSRFLDPPPHIQALPPSRTAIAESPDPDVH